MGLDAIVTSNDAKAKSRTLRPSDEPSEGREVYAPTNAPFEAPAKEFVAGPFYKDAAEILPELDEAQADGEIARTGKLNVDRRDFMRLFSASAMLGSAAACVRRPEEKAVPYVNQPVDLALGVPTYYATTCGECASGCGVIVKTREGRPVKVEGHPSNLVSTGSTCALSQAQLQGLYHPERYKKPKIKRGNRVDAAEWDETFEILASRVKAAKNVAIVTGASTGHQREFFESVLRHFGMPASNLYTFEANSLGASIAAAHRAVFGADGIPRAELSRAQLIVGIGSDFLEIGVSPVYMAKQFAEGHNYKAGKMGEFVQFESLMTQTGARADTRFVIAPGDEFGVALLWIDTLLENARSKGSSNERSEIRAFLNQHAEVFAAAKSRYQWDGDLKEIADKCVASKAVFLCGSSASFDENQTLLQVAAIALNILVGAYEDVLRFNEGWLNAGSRAGDAQRFKRDAKKIDMLFVVHTDPVHALPSSFGIKDALGGIKEVISIQAQPAAVDALATGVLPGNHPLESWGDEEAIAGYWSCRQPVVRAFTDSRQAEDIFLWIAAASGRPMKYREYREYLLERWRPLYDLSGLKVSYDHFVKAFLREGSYGRFARRSVGAFRLSSEVREAKAKKLEEGLCLVTPLDVRLREGRGANKPVLQEVGDSMTTIAWDSFVCLNPKTAAKLGFKRNDVLTIEGPAGSFEAALYPLPGLHADAVYVPRGNGYQEGVSRVTDGVGVNPLIAFNESYDAISGDVATSIAPVKLSRTGRVFRLAAQQKHNDLANRKDIVKKMTVERARSRENITMDLDTVPDLYPTLPDGKYRWGMAIDLGACTGCSACMVACATENNVPQVGRENINEGREMHWIRLDRYFAGDPDNPEVTYQPVMCQHCNHAPCEGVCPVFATSHDPEGMNQQTYNRCVGTRYCANACPYKVRRFNWFTHKWNEMGALARDRNPRALNPDVTVRTRGIMEKCTFCIQRIREAKHYVAEKKIELRDGLFKSACQQVCPSNAITFGNLLDKTSKISKDRADQRAYLLLGGDPEVKHYGIKTLPNVSYLQQVTWKESVVNQDKHHSSGGHEGETENKAHGSEHG